jgi:hypothetical protein
VKKREKKSCKEREEMNRRQNDRKGGVWKLDDILGHSYK